MNKCFHSAEATSSMWHLLVVFLCLFTISNYFLTKQSTVPTCIITVVFISHQHNSHLDIIRPLFPIAGCCSRASSRSSELSCSQSHIFDELEAIAPRSPSCPSVCQPSDSPRSASPDTGRRTSTQVLTLVYLGCNEKKIASVKANVLMSGCGKP